MSRFARPLIIDSSGFVRPRPAREFQHSIIDILRFDLVVETGDSDAIDETLRSFPDLAANRTIRLPVSSAIRTRSSDERRRYRDRRFGEHFAGAPTFRFDDARVEMTGRVPQHHGDHPRSDKIRDTLVGLADGLLLGLGLAEAWGGSGLEIWTAVADAAQVASI